MASTRTIHACSRRRFGERDRASPAIRENVSNGNAITVRGAMSRIRSSGCGGALVGRAHQQGRLAEKMARLHYFSKPSRSVLTWWCKSGGAPDTTRTVFPVVSNRNIVGTAMYRRTRVRSACRPWPNAVRSGAHSPPRGPCPRATPPPMRGSRSCRRGAIRPTTGADAGESHASVDKNLQNIVPAVIVGAMRRYAVTLTLGHHVSHHPGNSSSRRRFVQVNVSGVRAFIGARYVSRRGW